MACFVDSETKTLISNVFSRPEVWDCRFEGYTNRKFKAESWNTIAKEMGVAEKVLRRRWKYLKSLFYLQHDKTTKCNSMKELLTVPQSPYYKLLMFLKDVSPGSCHSSTIAKKKKEKLKPEKKAQLAQEILTFDEPLTETIIYDADFICYDDDIVIKEVERHGEEIDPVANFEEVVTQQLDTTTSNDENVQMKKVQCSSLEIPKAPCTPPEIDRMRCSSLQNEKLTFAPLEIIREHSFVENLKTPCPPPDINKVQCSSLVNRNVPRNFPELRKVLGSSLGKQNAPRPTPEVKKIQCLTLKPSLPKQPSTPGKIEDDDFLFFRSLLPHIRLIPTNKKLRFRNRFQAIVDEFAYPSSPSSHQHSMSVEP